MVKFLVPIFMGLMIQSCKTVQQTSYSSLQGIDDDSSCKKIDNPPACGWYRTCLEDSVECGNTGYALGYGEKYCTAFANLKTKNECTKQWRDKVTVCLQESLLNAYVMDGLRDCNGIRKYAFDTHPECYTSLPTSVCYLPVSELKKIFDTIENKDLISSEAITQIIEASNLCLKYLAKKFLAQNFKPMKCTGAIDPARNEEARLVLYAFWTETKEKYEQKQSISLIE